MVKKYLWAGVLLLVVIGGYSLVNALFSEDYDIPTVTVDRGELVIALDESGTVDAKRAVTLTSPRIRGLQITWLAPEGSTVEEGDVVIRFDASEQVTELADDESTLKIQRSALARARQEMTIQQKQLQLDLEKARRNYDEQKHEAPRVAEVARLELEVAELNFQAKLDQLKGDVEKAEVEVQRAVDRVSEARRELEQMTIAAPISGLVVYMEIWKGSQMAKVQEGDSPWPGQGLVNLPDLSEMMVNTTVSEVDASLVDTLQAVTVTLDAFAGMEYRGKVTRKGTLARKKDPTSNINVFDVEVTILDHDDNLKPGMSASCRIIVDRIPDVVSAPLEAIFEKEGRTVVYLANRREREVEVGRKNDTSIEIVSGLEAGDKVCLLDPTLDEAGLPGDRATEPELNRDRGRDRNGSRGGDRGGGGRSSGSRRP